MGKVTVASSDTEEGVAALHAYAAVGRKMNELLSQWKPPMTGEKKSDEGGW
jgi:hypothetical protein